MGETKTANINSRIKSDIKQQAEAILGRLGISRSTAIDMYYRQIIMHNGIPFPVTVTTNVPVRSDMTDADFDQMMAEGYEQAIADNSYDLDEVFDDLEGDFDGRL